MVASSEGPVADLEFIGGGSEENLEDRVRQLQQHDSEIVAESELSLQLLWHYATSVRHQQYHGTDIITVPRRRSRNPVDGPYPQRGVYSGNLSLRCTRLSMRGKRFR